MRSGNAQDASEGCGNGFCVGVGTDVARTCPGLKEHVDDGDQFGTHLIELESPERDDRAQRVDHPVLDNPRLYCHCEHMSTTKEERLQIRVGPADKALLERAAAASHLNVSAFVVQAAASKAEEILAERSSIRLTREAAVAFTEALERPAEVNDRLATAMRRKRTFSWLD